MNLFRDSWNNDRAYRRWRQRRQMANAPHFAFVLVALMVAVWAWSHKSSSLVHFSYPVPPATGSLPSEEAGESKVTVSLVAVNDGDTITVLDQEGNKMRIRLYGIDCPELEQFYGPEAKAATEGLVTGKRLTIVTKDVDPYGRTVALVYADNISVNATLINAGYAWWYKQYAKQETRFAELEKEARAAKRGLWAYPNPQPPWIWRREHPRE